MSDPIPTPAPASAPIYTLCYKNGAVVAIRPGIVAQSGCQTATGTMADLDAIIDERKLKRLPDPAIAAAAAAAKAAAQKTFAAAVAAGYTVPGVTPPLVLDLSDAAQARFTSLLVFSQTAIAAGRMTLDDPFPVTDINGVPRVLSVGNVQTMILGYGEYYAGLFAALHTPTAAPTAAPAA